jgi:hypothetical protein
VQRGGLATTNVVENTTLFSYILKQKRDRCGKETKTVFQFHNSDRCVKQHAAVEKEPLPKTSSSPFFAHALLLEHEDDPESRPGPSCVLSLQSLISAKSSRIKRPLQLLAFVDHINNPPICSHARPPQANNARRPYHLHRRGPLKHHPFSHSFLPLNHLADYLKLRKRRPPGQSSWHLSSCKRLQTRQAALPQVAFTNTILDESYYYRFEALTF